MSKVRGFEAVSEYAGKVSIPERKTARSAGYDIACAEDAVLQPGRVVAIPTGLKAYMQEDEYLGLYVRSGFSVKNNVSCVNSVGIIDSDYYNNEDNEGHIRVPLINHGDKTLRIDKGTRIAQGIFHKYMVADKDEGNGNVRKGGFGSTGV